MQSESCFSGIDVKKSVPQAIPRFLSDAKLSWRLCRRLWYSVVIKTGFLSQNVTIWCQSPILGKCTRQFWNSLFLANCMVQLYQTFCFSSMWVGDSAGVYSAVIDAALVCVFGVGEFLGVLIDFSGADGCAALVVVATCMLPACRHARARNTCVARPCTRHLAELCDSQNCLVHVPDVRTRQVGHTIQRSDCFQNCQVQTVPDIWSFWQNSELSGTLAIHFKQLLVLLGRRRRIRRLAPQSNARTPSCEFLWQRYPAEPHLTLRRLSLSTCPRDSQQAWCACTLRSVPCMPWPKCTVCPQSRIPNCSVSARSTPPGRRQRTQAVAFPCLEHARRR